MVRVFNSAPWRTVILTKSSRMEMVIPEDERESFKWLIGPEGFIERSLLKQRDEVFEAYLHQGLLSEVLAFAIEK